MNKTINHCRKQKSFLAKPLFVRGALCTTQSGFTLVELVVGLMLAVIVIAAAGSLIIFGSNLLSNTAERSSQQADVTNVAAKISEELRLAQSIELVNEQALPSALSENQHLLYIGDENGNVTNVGFYYVQHGGQDALPRNYFGVDWYGAYRVSLDYEVRVEEDEIKLFEIRVSAFTAEGTKMHTSSVKSFELVNSESADQPFVSAQAKSEDTKFYLLYTYWQEGAAFEDITADGDNPAERGIEWEVPVSGYYKLEAWGADGGGHNPGLGGYASGVVNLIEGTTVYLNPGEAGSLYNEGGAYIWHDPTFGGGGGVAGNEFSITSSGSCTGGGSSDIRVLSDDLYHRVIVAGGGGGAGFSQFGVSGPGNLQGGHGGGDTGMNGTSFNGYRDFCYGYGGTQTAGGLLSSGTNKPYYGSFIATPGAFQAGGSGAGYSSGGAGGGGGWYGGAGAMNNSGGGGSGYVLTSSSYKPSGYFAEHMSYYLSEPLNVSVDDARYVEKPRTGHGGFVKISLIS